MRSNDSLLASACEIRLNLGLNFVRDFARQHRCASYREQVFVKSYATDPDRTSSADPLED